MKFRPFDMKIRQLFGGTNIFEIPNFQRSYSWKQKNYEEFFEDILKSCKSYINEEGLYCEKKDNNYFFGTLIFVGRNDNPDVNKPYIVVDGQQRLTTMTLFFQAILKHIEKIDENYKNEYREKCIFTNYEFGKKKEYQRLKNKNLNPIFPVNILNSNNKKEDGAEHKPKNNPQKWLINSYDIIYKMLEKSKIIYLLNKKNSNKDIDEKNITDKNYIEFLDEIGNKLLNSTVIAIFSEEEASANILYRNFNSRGIPLTQVDLIKNELFSILEDDSDSAITSWGTIEDNMYDINDSINTFFYHYMIGRYKKITKDNIFEKFSEKIKPDQSGYINFLKNLVLNSEYYRAIVNPTDDTEIFSKKNYFKRDDNPMIKRNLIFLKEIDLKQVRILFLTLFEAMEKDVIKSTDFRKTIEVITLHQSLHVLSKSPANKLTSIYKKNSNDLFKAIVENKKIKKFSDKIKKELIEKLPEKSTVITSKKLEYDHKNSVEEMNNKAKKERALIKKILFTLAINKQTKETQRGNDGFDFIYNSTIEHIIDQKNRNKNVKSLGNLILLERSEHFNSQKKKEMYSKSKITLTNRFYNDYNNFSVEEIANREKDLLEEYYECVKNYN